jgi:hypothetical protein
MKKLILITLSSTTSLFLSFKSFEMYLISSLLASPSTGGAAKQK